MTQTYSQIQRQIEALQRQAEKMREQEVTGVVSRIREAIAHYGLTADQLGYGASGKSAQPNKQPDTGKAVNTSGKYADGSGNSWSGRGPRPGWLRNALAAGRALEEFAVGVSPAKASRQMTKSPKKRTAKVSYSDGAGHSWSGFGPRPGWLKDAVAAGRTLEEMAS
jgi:DNA-binding protein H-NS